MLTLIRIPVILEPGAAELIFSERSERELGQVFAHGGDGWELGTVDAGGFDNGMVHGLGPLVG